MCRLSKTEQENHYNFYFPLPLVDDILEKFQNSKLFFTVYLKNGFFHVDVEENSRIYISSVTHEGQYEFLKVSLALTTGPSVISRYLSHVFCELLKNGIFILYMDGIIIPSEDEKWVLEN